MGLLRGERVENGYRPSAIQRWLLPGITGNEINGLGETARRRPTPVYHWFGRLKVPFNRASLVLLTRSTLDRASFRHLRKSWKYEKKPLAPLAKSRVERSPGDWSAAIKQFVLDHGADVVGIVPMNREWVFEGFEVEQKWIVMLGFAMNYEELSKLPEAAGANEVLKVYADGQVTVWEAASWLRRQGWDASGYCGPMGSPITMIPPALAAGFGELGKHGSIIHRDLGANMRLAYLLTDVPLEADAPDEFGADDFCARCQVCTRECPADAIGPRKQMVRGVEKWYVDFDKCLPYFNDTQGCGICLAVCPWSRPGVAPGLLSKLAGRRSRHGGVES